MNPTRRSLVSALALSPIAAAFGEPALAQSGEYSTLPNALPVENPAKVEIAEF